MKELIKEIIMPDLTSKQRLIVWYFIVSLFMLCITDDSSIWMILFVVLNFANAARLVRKVPLADLEKDHD